MPGRGIRIALALVALLAAPLGAADAPARIVAIGDVHGAYQQFVDILSTTGLIDAAGDWSGGKTQLVQTGDLTDRGTDVRAVIELLMKLERQAAESGGRVHALLGNHEMMNLIANDRDALVNPAIFAAFAGPDSEARREQAAKAWVKWRRGRQQVQRRLDPEGRVELSPELTAFFEHDRDRWLATHPPGLLEYRGALGPEGDIGRWLRGLRVAVRLGDTLFLHGGIGPELSGTPLDDIDELHQRHVADWDATRQRLEKRRIILPHFSWAELRAALEHQLYFPTSAGDRALAAEAWDQANAMSADLFAAESALWYRGYAPLPLGLPDEALAELLDGTDSAYGVRRTVAGHTPIPSHSVLERLGGRLYLIDTGMLTTFYGGRAAALEITASGAAPVYADAEPRVASVGRAPAATLRPVWASATAVGADARIFLDADGQPLPFQQLAELERFLREATVVSSKPVGQGKSGAIKVLLERDGTRAHAIFHSIDEREGSPRRPVVLHDGTRLMYFRDSYESQIAAYELSKLLDMDNVPPAVERKLDRERGSMALWIENGTNLFGWREEKGDDPADPRLHRQLHDMRVFDNLIDNTDRNSQNIFWSGDFQLWLIDHTRAFSQSRKLVRPDRVSRCSRRMYQALVELQADDVNRELEPYLTPFEIKSLLRRRDQVLKILRQKIEERGETKVLFDHESTPGVTVSPREA